MKTALSSAARRACRYWPIIWPNLVMAGSMMAGFLLSPFAFALFRPDTELGAHVVLAACVLCAMTLAFTGLVFAGRAVAPQVPAIVMWIVGLTAAVVLLMIF